MHFKRIKAYNIIVLKVFLKKDNKAYNVTLPIFYLLEQYSHSSPFKIILLWHNLIKLWLGLLFDLKMCFSINPATENNLVT